MDSKSSVNMPLSSIFSERIRFTTFHISIAFYSLCYIRRHGSVVNLLLESEVLDKVINRDNLLGLVWAIGVIRQACFIHIRALDSGTFTGQCIFSWLYVLPNFILAQFTAGLYNDVIIEWPDYIPSLDHILNCLAVYRLSVCALLNYVTQY